MGHGTKNVITRIEVFSCGYCQNYSHLMFRNTPKDLIQFPAKVLLFEHQEKGRFLVDTGYGAGVFNNGWKSALYLALNKTYFREEEGIAYQLRERGISDLQEIILTHLHPDHIGGLREFDEIPIILAKEALRSLESPKTLDVLFENLLPSDFHDRVRTVEVGDPSPLEGFQGLDYFGDNSLWFIDLPGHARGQTGLFFPEKKLFYLVDALWDIQFLNKELRLFPRLIQHDFNAYKNTVDAVRQLKRSRGDIQFLTSHGTEEVVLD